MIAEISIILGFSVAVLATLLGFRIRETYLDMKANEAEVRKRLGINKND